MSRHVTRSVTRSGLAIAALALGLAACSIPDTAFRATPDAGPGGDRPSTLSIVVSASTLALDEGASKDITVALSQAPGGPLSVSIASTAMTKLAVSVPTLLFTPSNFDQPQPVTVTALGDPDTIDEHADISVTAPGVDPVAIATTVHDLDKVAIVVGGANPVMLSEGTQTAINVHLSAQPTGDVVVSAMIGSGPVTVSPATRVFTASNYATDQSFTITATPDADTLENDEVLTLSAPNVPDKVVMIQDLDIDVQSLVVKVAPVNQTITEQTTTAAIDVSLSQQPSRNVTVTVTASGQAHVDVGQLTFTPQNYATTQRVTVDAPGDPDTVDGTGSVTLHATDPDRAGSSLDRTITLTVKDDDQQAILEDAPSPLQLTETTSAMFNVTLAFQPTQDVVVSVSSLDGTVATATPGTLTFTPANYNQPHMVRVDGIHDSNLATNTTSIRLFQAAIGTKDVPVSVADVDHQAIVLSASSLSVPEGTSKTFDVSLMFDPGASVTVNLANDNQAALPISLAPNPPPQNGMLSIPFTSASYATPVHVTVSPPVDSNNASEMATVTASGGGAQSAQTIALNTVDATVIQTWGWPTPFSTTTQVSGGFAIAYKINVGAVANLDAFHVYVPTGVGLFRMALYTDVSGKPGHLLAQMGDGKVMVDRTNDGPPLASTQLTDPAYWLAVRFSASVNIGYDLPDPSVNRCISNSKYATISDPWVTDFTDVTCGNDHLFNIWITTYHQ